MHFQTIRELSNHRDWRTPLTSFRIGHAAISQPHEGSDSESRSRWLGEQRKYGLNLLQAVRIRFLPEARFVVL
jgi:hypothetical protein